MAEHPRRVRLRDCGGLEAPANGMPERVKAKPSTDQAVTAFVKYLASAPAAAYWSEAKLEPAATYMRTRASQ